MADNIKTNTTTSKPGPTNASTLKQGPTSTTTSKPSATTQKPATTSATTSRPTTSALRGNTTNTTTSRPNTSTLRSNTANTRTLRPNPSTLRSNTANARTSQGNKPNAVNLGTRAGAPKQNPTGARALQGNKPNTVRKNTKIVLIDDVARSKLIQSNNAFIDLVTINSKNQNFNLYTNDIESASAKELEDLLRTKLDNFFKKYVEAARQSKNVIEKKYTELTKGLESNYIQFKKTKVMEFEKESEANNKRLAEIKRIISQYKIEIEELNSNLLKKIENNDLGLETDSVASKSRRKSRGHSRGVNLNSNTEMKLRISEIEKEINKLKVEEIRIVEKINTHQLRYITMVDDLFTKKQNKITKLDIDKIETYIWIRDNLIIINRIIRDIKVNIALHKIDAKRTEFYESLESVVNAVDKIKEEFDLFDSIENIKSLIEASESINTNARIINLKPGDAL